MSNRDIEPTNVLPAYEASLHFGATEEEIAKCVGWRRDDLHHGAPVTGESTYLHMELMAQKADFHNFILAAVALHNASSLGVVGLACRSCVTMEEAFGCHRRYQHLTNRTAEYAIDVASEWVTLTENRFGEARQGSVLVSDYTILVALHLLRVTAARAPKVRVLRSRRTSMPSTERAAYESFAGASVELGATNAQLVFDTAFLATPVKTADDELADYFQRILRQAVPQATSEPTIIESVSEAIRESLIHGTPSAASVAQSLGLGHRTLQRRLSQAGGTFSQLLETTRRKLAERYLVDQNFSLSEIAYLLGYSEQASFYRSFRRWHDMTPAEYRRDAQRG